jgi:predicted dehydrogenase
VKFSRVLIVGRGSIGRRHYNLAKSLFPDASIAVFSSSVDQDGFPNRFRTKYEISEFKPEISVIANTADLHLEFAIFLAKLNSHLLIEKPISINSAGIETLLGEIERRKLHVMVGYNLLYLPSLRLLHSLLADQSIGHILDVRVQAGQDLQTWRPNRDYRSTASASKKKGGGVLRELSHEISYVLSLFGAPTWIFANLNRVSNLEIDVEDVAHILFGLKDDAGRDFSARIDLDFVRKDKVRSCTIIGSEGTLEWNGLTGEVHKDIGSGKQEIVGSGPWDSDVDSYRMEWENFLDSITNKTVPSNVLQNAILTLRVIEACEESDSRGCRVFLNHHGGGIS